MRYYQFDPVTGHLLGVLPSAEPNTTTVEPPTLENHYSVFDGESWALVPRIENPQDPSVAEADLPDVMAIEILKQHVIARVENFASEIRRKATGVTDPLEAAAWSNRLRIARLVKEGATLSPEDHQAFSISVMSRGQGETFDQFSTKVIASAVSFQVLAEAVDGLKSRGIRLIKSSHSQIEINRNTKLLLEEASSLLKLLGITM